MVQCKLKDNLGDHPFWRTEDQKKATPTIPKMIEEILEFKKIWDRFLKNIKDESRAYVEEQLKEIEIAFFVSVQVEEGIGMGTQEEDSDEKLPKDKVREDTEKILEDIERIELEEKTDKHNFDYKRTKSVETVLDTYRKGKEKNNKPAAKNEEELTNLYKARKYLKQLIQLEQNDQKFSQLLELDIIKTTHEILMENLLEGKSGQPGHFSKSQRFGSFKGKEHHYPHIPDDKVTTDILTALVDCYNSSVDKQKREIDELNSKTLQQIFQSAAKFLFIFLQLHPFSDGNGRLGRLLCSYFLELICPFPSSIYNVYSPTEKSDYVKVLVAAREGIDFNVTLNNKSEGLDFFGKLYDHDESNMTALIIESNWFSWKKFINVLQKKFKDECILM